MFNNDGMCGSLSTYMVFMFCHGFSIACMPCIRCVAVLAGKLIDYILLWENREIILVCFNNRPKFINTKIR